jgi:hypothetical protein
MTATAVTESAYQLAIRQAREQFEGFIAEHEMTVLLDELEQGRPYRHIRFAKPGTGFYSFNLTTWPGYLAITGGLEAYTFRRLPDMFDFFRGAAAVNPGYWGEKLVAESHGTEFGRVRYAPERYRESVREHLAWRRDELSPGEWSALCAVAERDLLAHPPTFIEEALELLDEFSWSSPAPVKPGDPEPTTVKFVDTWDWDLGGYGHHFLLAIHAVQWGVNRYLEQYPDRLIREGAAA